MAKADDKEFDFINQSGNIFHCEVYQYFKNLGWDVLVSPYYLDGVTDKPREIDLVVEKSIEATRGQNDLFRVNLRLFIECKYINTPTVFWFDAKNRDKALELLIERMQLDKGNAYTDAMHYLENKNVAKLFESKGSTDPIYLALTQCLHSMVNIHDLDIFKANKNPNYYDYTVTMPVIMCKNFDNFRQTTFSESGSISTIDDSFQLEVDYAYLDNNGSKKNDYFLIDVVNFDQKADFIEIIEQDFKNLCTSYQYDSF